MRLATVLALLVGVAAAGTAPAVGAPTLSVDASAGRHAISPDIYGMNFADPTLAKQIGLPVDRFGGNKIETYNYRNSASNTAVDYYFENVAGCFGVTDCSSPDYPDRDQIAFDRRVGAASLIQLPLMGYVAVDAPTDHPFTCGFPRTTFPAQDSVDPFDTNCGNGMNGGTRLDPGTPTRDGVAVGPSFDRAEVAADVARYGTAAHRGVRFYEPGNEPGLWSETHQDMHFADETNSELIAKFTAAAAAVKAADRTAKVIGPSEWGWINYFCDRQSFHAGTCHPPQSGSSGPATPAVAAFLDAMRAHKRVHGVRLLDDLDLHYYPAGGGDDPAITRSLWDRTYTDPSYIDSPIDLIGRMHQLVAKHDPGIKISLSEYNLDLGGSDHAADTLLEADALGIFARERLDMATEWGPPKATDPEADAFRLYRDYDGHGARFGATWVRSTSSDQRQLAVYGALRARPAALTVAVINKTAGALSSTLSLAGVSPLGAARVWQSTGAGFVRQRNVAVVKHRVTVAYAAKSLTMVVLSRGRAAPTSPRRAARAG